MPSLNVIFNANAQPYERELKKIESVTNSFFVKLSGLIGLGSIISAVKATVSWADNLRNVSDNLQVNVEWLQKMQNGAMLTGASISDLAKLINTINRSRGIALQKPSGSASQAFERFGISQSDIRNLSTQQFVDRLVSAFKNGTTTEMANDLQAVGGKSARNLIGAFAAQFQNDIPVLAERMVNELANMDDAFRGLTTTLMVAFAPAIIHAVDGLKNMIRWINETGSAAGYWAGSPSASAKANQNADAVLRSARTAVWSSNLNRPLTARENAIVNSIMSGSRDIISNNSRVSIGQDLINASEDDRKSQEAIDLARRSDDNARRRRENSPPGFDNLSPASKEKAKFLGGELTSNQKVGSYALPGATTLVDVTKSMDKKLGGLMSAVLDISEKMDSGSDDDEHF